jgi:putative ABC transport system ATP-binding protein
MSTPSPSQPLIELQAVQKAYQVGPISIQALRGVSFSVWPGEFVAVVGPSGSGKSTLLNMIAGVDRLSAGEVLVGGRSIHRLREAERARWRGASVGIVFQFFQMLPTMTLLANVMLPMELAGKYTPAQRHARAEELLTRVGLREHIHKLPSRVSGRPRSSSPSSPSRPPPARRC